MFNKELDFTQHLEQLLTTVRELEKNIETFNEIKKTKIGFFENNTNTEALSVLKKLQTSIEDHLSPQIHSTMRVLNGM